VSFEASLAARAQEIRALLMAQLSGGTRLEPPMRHALEGGKGLRGWLAVESGQVLGLDPRQTLPAAAAIEAMHAYSLVHDDLPCMDDDDLRRGRPTVHVAWDEATAVLTGDALQALAFRLLAQVPGDPARVVQLVAGLAEAAGHRGMVQGQALDLAAETAPAPLTLAEITELQRGKTGALIEWSCLVGPVLAGAPQAPMRRYAEAIGLAFQIADDILDVEGNADATGKRVGKDAAAGKATFVSLMGLEPARARARALIEEACDALEGYGARAGTLREAARFVIARRN
jgi:farnesyl diphosphate synthase